ncbi:MAG: hypothetical protein R3C13_14900, partial [Hyphomonas sp.]|uniref:hypothetical protein n=1 Tax=Hyphomonas sp. TaxID=87 RepID=UPI003528B70A
MKYTSNSCSITAEDTATIHANGQVATTKPLRDGVLPILLTRCFTVQKMPESDGRLLFADAYASRHQ